MKDFQDINVENQAFWRYLAYTNPYIWEIIHPHQVFNFLPSESEKNLIASMAIKSLNGLTDDAFIKNRLTRIGKHLFEVGVHNLTYNDCGNELNIILRPQADSLSIWNTSHNNPEPPQPDPLKSNAFIGEIIILLSKTISISSIAHELKIMGERLIHKNTIEEELMEEQAYRV